ncbi:SPOR domain-containing protein [Tabrizicola piscis]|uniref:SPOR domain-containing protein n=1 Tax=Tabrizicola piscis TaxID=2494374 RepID=A0A3S8UB29_9RHOB|nr:SPOR domain-containing protein [Tabrizicola piscis]AZL60922.1 SPOR domain-containing protein [Tabrizicola piscis]
MADADYEDHGGQYDADAPPHWPGAHKFQRWVTLAGAVASVGLVVGLGFWGYRLAVRDVTGVPVVQALDGPMRIAPDNPGGEIASHQGLSVNDVAESGVAAAVPETLILAPRPVELAPEDTAGLAAPQMPGLAEVSAPLPDPGVVDPAGADLALAAAPPVESASPTELAVDAALAEALGLDPDPAPAANAGSLAAASTDPLSDPLADSLSDAMPATAEIAPAGAITLSPRPRARPLRAAEAPAPTEAMDMSAVNEIDPATIPLGTRLVQFGAFDSADEARAEWARLQGSFGDLLAEKAMVVQPAESGGRTFFRLRAHGFEDETDARRFCSAFVAQEATCIPVPQR